jgi:IS5 family transposase
LIQAWAGHKSFIPKGQKKKKTKSRNPDDDFRGKKRSNKTHESKTDPGSRMFRKGFHTPANLCMMGHILMENRNGLAVGGLVTQAATEKEREAALEMAKKKFQTKKRRTLAGDKGYDVASFVNELRDNNITPHLAKKKSCGGRLDGRTLRHPGYKISQVFRKRVEQIFGWLKSVGLMRQTHFRGLTRINWMFQLSLATYNLLRMKNLQLVMAPP